MHTTSSTPAPAPNPTPLIHPLLLSVLIERARTTQTFMACAEAPLLPVAPRFSIS